ncbi:MAG: DUF6505 family protein [Gammaproteobacteria bacterium]|nr:MAG: DUF6505 family protein [Gammaproteobacteria bacterium]
MKFLRAVRLDDSDSHLYEQASEPGEWAVPGSFAFLDMDPQSLEGKRLQAFKSGFLGTRSFGWTTLVEIAEIDDDEYQQVIDRLAAHFMEHYGAPHIAAALPAAGEEADYASTICEHPLATLLAIERDFGEQGIVESLKVIKPNAGNHSNVKLWAIEED